MVAIFFAASFLLTTAPAQSPLLELASARSVSGQFVVIGSMAPSPLLHRPELATNANLVRLEPTLLAVAAERLKTFLWNAISLRPDTPWRGKITLKLRPARSTDDGVTIVSQLSSRNWNYRVELPDVLPCVRYVHSLTAVVLLEIANRNAPVSGHSAEIPAWMADGLAQQALAEEPDKVILSAASKSIDGMMQNRVEKTRQGVNPLAGALHTLQNSPALTFQQLCWPTDAQVDGADGGVYHASAQLFVSELLRLKDGSAKLRELLARLPQGLNWQTAFFSAFRENFLQPLEVEKWWSLRVIAFAGKNPGPRWDVAASWSRFTELLSVPVEFRSSSNSLPERAEISLQSAILNLDPSQRSFVLRVKLRDFELARFRLATPFATLADGYQSALADFMDEKKTASGVPMSGKRAVAMRRNDPIEDTVKKLNALDVRRREAEIRLKLVKMPESLHPVMP
ncbi:MAG: hypothetical protein WCH99_12720 [Verrucomicrobiota bacterium]